MDYTQRRATLENTRGVDWVHGGSIGIATSNDGLQWTYRGTIQIRSRTRYNHDRQAQAGVGEPHGQSMPCTDVEHGHL